jgi:hypothetical protein
MPTTAIDNRNPFSNPDDDQPRVVWDAANIGHVIDRTERQAFHMLKRGQIRCARKVGALHCAPFDGLLEEFGLSKHIRQREASSGAGRTA